MLLGLTGCNDPKMPGGPVLNSPSSTSVSSGVLPSQPASGPAQTDEPEIGEPYESYQQVIRGERPFFYVHGQEHLKFSDLRETITPDELDLIIQKFTLLDLDGDGVDEIVLDLAFIEGVTVAYAIFHEQDGEILEYTEVARGLQNLKADGTFGYSGGVAAGGYGKIVSFAAAPAGEEDGYNPCYETQVLIHHEDGKFYIGAEECTQREYETAQEEQSGKENALWNDYIEEDIRSFLHQ